MTYPVIKRHQIFVDIDRRHIADWKSRENGISKVSPPSTESGHTYMSAKFNPARVPFHTLDVTRPKMASRISTADRCCLLVVLGSRKYLFRAWRPGPCQSICRALPHRLLWQGPGRRALKRFFWAQVRREGKSCRVSHLQTTLSQDTLENFVIEDVVAGLEVELPLLSHAISGALADTKESTRTNLWWTNTFSYV